MNDSSLKKAASMNSISSAPRRPQKLGSVQSIVKDETDKNVPSPFEEITLSDDDEEISAKMVKCPTCSRDMTIWTSYRRGIHTKVCRTKQEEKETKEKRRTKLTEILEKDDKILEKPAKEFRESQRSWELSKNNVKFARIAADDEENRKRKRPRSFAVVELAPKKCQCEVLTTLQSRFIDEFHSKSVRNKNSTEQGVTEHSYQMKRMIGKLSRYEQLSVDMQKMLDDTSELFPTIVTFKCSDANNVKSQALVLKHRTSLIRLHPKTDMIVIEQSSEVFKIWLTFVFSANIEWNDNQKDDIKELAIKYGPIGLDNLIKGDEKSERNEENGKVHEPNPEAFQQKEPSTMPIRVPFDDEIEVMGSEEPNLEEVNGSEVLSENEGTANYFISDDPYIGFGKTVENADEDIKEEDVIVESDSRSSFTSTPQKSKENITMDSFDEWSNQPGTSAPSTVTTTTPVRNAVKPVFGSHVKILKTTDITPMPQFDTMDETELKERMKEIGMRPKGKKVMIQILKKAYTALHPEICTGTPTIRPLIRIDEAPEPMNVAKTGKSRAHKTLSERIAASPKKTAIKKTPPKKPADPFEDSQDDTDADKTLNISNDEREAGKICGDDVVDDEDDEDEVATSSSSGKSELNALRVSFLEWIRNEQNAVLHEHILSLQPVSLEEMLIRLEKAEGPLGRIGKGKLVKLLESLRITYQLPPKPGKARGGFKRRL